MQELEKFYKRSSVKKKTTFSIFRTFICEIDVKLKCTIAKISYYNVVD